MPWVNFFLRSLDQANESETLCYLQLFAGMALEFQKPVSGYI